MHHVGAVVASLARAVREPPFPFTLPASVRVERALEGAVRTHDSSMRELRAAVEACVAELHAQGMPPEAVLVTMRAFTRHAAILHPPPGYAPSSWAADALMDQIIQWSILAYFRNEIQPDLPAAAPPGERGGGSAPIRP